MKWKCLTFTALTNIDAGNPNSGYNEDIIATIKKIKHPTGESYPYISGQAIRRMARERLRDAGYPISPKDPSIEDKKAPFPTACDPIKTYDDDLFGFMNAKERLSRTSPVRVSPAFALFPFNYDRDLGIQHNVDIGKEHRMFETELTNNWFTYTVLVELDRVGKGQREIKKGKDFTDWEVPVKERVLRVNALLDVFRHLWGGGKQSRILTSMEPHAIAISIQSVKNPIWMGRVKVSETGVLEEHPLQRTIEENAGILNYKAVGVDNAKVKSQHFTQSPHEAFEGAKKLIVEGMWSE